MIQNLHEKVKTRKIPEKEAKTDFVGRGVEKWRKIRAVWREKRMYNAKILDKWRKESKI